MSTPRVASRPRPPKPSTVVPIRPPSYLEGQDLDELTDVARGVRLLDLAIQGLHEVSKGSMIDRDYHIEPLVFAAIELHGAVIKLEARLRRVRIPFPRETATPA